MIQKYKKYQDTESKQGSDALMFCDELKHLCDASKMLPGDIFTRAKKINMFLNKIKREAKLCLECKSELSSQQIRFGEKISTFLSSAEKECKILSDSATNMKQKCISVAEFFGESSTVQSSLRVYTFLQKFVEKFCEVKMAIEAKEERKRMAAVKKAGLKILENTRRRRRRRKSETSSSK